MDREELEAVIWATLNEYRRPHRRNIRNLDLAVRRALAAVDAYVATEVPAIVDRRAQVEKAVGRGSYGGHL